LLDLDLTRGDEGRAGLRTGPSSAHISPSNLPAVDSYDGLRALLAVLDAPARDHLRRVLVMDDEDRKVVVDELLRYGDQQGDTWAGTIRVATLTPDIRRRIVRLLGELSAGE
jgi:hypothetical protein